MARLSVVFIAVFPVMEEWDAVGAIARVRDYYEGVRAVWDRFFAVGVRLVFQLVVLATSVRLERAIRFRWDFFRFDNYLVYFYGVVSVSFGVNDNLSARTSATAARSGLNFVRFKVNFRVLARAVTSFYRHGEALVKVVGISVR